MSKKYYREELERIDSLLASKRELVFRTSLECQGLKLLKKEFEQKLGKLEVGAHK
ncbi:hypothetical protein [Paenilisteria weihenstephanensis]|uniref:hypothetical protein n=1 Tax=Listeria weihenstephanensis TaxID=1006155 RepID=UPI0004BAA268|nr:hypothetical protein [Listeria weihenstephanensis]